MQDTTSSLRNADLWDVVWWILRRYRRYRVTGNSMRPLLVPGQEVLLDTTAYLDAPPRSGDIVVAYHPQKPGFRIIKRVASVAGGSDRCHLLGDNAEASTDSRQFGPVSMRQIQGQVVCRFP